MKLEKALLLASVCAFAACAGQTYRANVGPMFLRPRAEAALQPAGGGPLSLQNSLNSDLGVGDTEVVPYVRLQTDIDRQRVRLHGFLVDAEGTGTTPGGAADNGYGGIPGGSAVRTTLEAFAIAANWSYQLARGRNYRIAGGAQIGWYGLDLTESAAAGTEVVETNVFVPMPYLEVEAFSGPLTIGANGGIMAGDFGDGSGRYVDLEGYLRFQADERFDILAGYRYLLLDAYGRASSRDFDADIDLQGIFVSAGIKF